MTGNTIVTGNLSKQAVLEEMESDFFSTQHYEKVKALPDDNQKYTLVIELGENKVIDARLFIEVVEITA